MTYLALNCVAPSKSDLMTNAKRALSALALSGSSRFITTLKFPRYNSSRTSSSMASQISGHKAQGHYFRLFLLHVCNEYYWRLSTEYSWVQMDLPCSLLHLPKLIDSEYPWKMKRLKLAWVKVSLVLNWAASEGIWRLLNQNNFRVVIKFFHCIGTNPFINPIFNQFLTPYKYLVSKVVCAMRSCWGLMF